MQFPYPAESHSVIMEYTVSVTPWKRLTSDLLKLCCTRWERYSSTGDGLVQGSSTGRLEQEEHKVVNTPTEVVFSTAYGTLLYRFDHR